MGSNAFKNYLVGFSLFALLGGCQELNHPPNIDIYEPSTYSDPCLVASVDAPATVKSGRAVDLKVSFQNTCKLPYGVHYHGADLILINKDNDVVWQAGAGSVVPVSHPGRKFKELSPGEVMTFDFRWNGQDGWNKRLAAGEYSFVSVLFLVDVAANFWGRIDVVHTIDIR